MYYEPDITAAASTTEPSSFGRAIAFGIVFSLGLWSLFISALIRLI